MKQKEVKQEQLIPTKEPVKKKSEKKKAVKKTVKSEMTVIAPDKYFFLVNGVALKNILELAENLEHMADDVFDYHVNNYKNDFSNWIKDVFLEPALAEQINVLKDKKSIEYVLLKFCARRYK